MTVHNKQSACCNCEGKKWTGLTCCVTGESYTSDYSGNRFFFFSINIKAYLGKCVGAKKYDGRDKGRGRVGRDSFGTEMCMMRSFTAPRPDANMETDWRGRTHYKTFGKTNVCISLVLLCEVEKSCRCQISRFLNPLNNVKITYTEVRLLMHCSSCNSRKLWKRLSG